MTTQDIDLGVVARGPQGPKGDTGEQGPQGPKGDTNETATNALNLANSASDKLSAIQANGGGRNLLLGTRDFSGSNWLNLGTAWTKTDETYNGLSVVETTDDWSGISQYYQVKKGETYTFSLFARYTSGAGTSQIYILLNSNPESGHQQAQLNNWSGAYALDTNWKKCIITFTATTDGYIKPRMERTNANTNVLRVCGFMLEKCIVSHDWSPSPEDIQSEIDAALNNKVNKSDLTWANISGKPSIPNADDTTTVSSGDLNNYTTTGKYYMPNGLVYYTNHPTTGTDMGDWFVMKVDAYHGGDMIVQTIYQINSGDVWIRQRWRGAWKSWRQINFWS